jgi:hypothetical protein
MFSQIGAQVRSENRREDREAYGPPGTIKSVAVADGLNFSEATCCQAAAGASVKQEQHASLTGLLERPGDRTASPGSVRRPPPEGDAAGFTHQTLLAADVEEEGSSMLLDQGSGLTEW